MRTYLFLRRGNSLRIAPGSHGGFGTKKHELDPDRERRRRFSRRVIVNINSTSNAGKNIYFERLYAGRIDGTFLGALKFPFERDTIALVGNITVMAQSFWFIREVEAMIVFEHLGIHSLIFDRDAKASINGEIDAGKLLPFSRTAASSVSGKSAVFKNIHFLRSVLATVHGEAGPVTRIPFARQLTIKIESEAQAFKNIFFIRNVSVYISGLSGLVKFIAFERMAAATTNKSIHAGKIIHISTRTAEAVIDNETMAGRRLLFERSAAGSFESVTTLSKRIYMQRQANAIINGESSADVTILSLSRFNHTRFGLRVG